VRDDNKPPFASDADRANEPQDGIEVRDAPVPRWSRWLFLILVLFAPAYFFFYHNGAEGRSLVDQYDRELAENLQLQFAEIGELQANREAVVEFLYKPTWLQIGKVVYKSNCASCHGQEGEGQIGPNLTDNRYKNIRDIEDILRIVQKGANAGAMPAWEERLSTNEIVLVASYAASLRGNEVDGGKAGEGKIIDSWPAPPKPEDATKGEAEEN